MKKISLVLIIAACLSGCSTAKAPIPYENYQRIATGDVTINECVKLGYMDYRVAAAGKNQLSNALNSWSYEPAIYQSVYANLSSQAQQNPPVKSQCDMASVTIIQGQQQMDQAARQQQIAQQQQQQMNQALQNSMPKTTYCNQIGTQTICNTY